MKASQRKSAKKDLLLQTAQRLMLRQGYWATSIDQICVTAKLSKGVFFHYFTSKKDLGRQTLQYFYNGILARLQRAFEAGPQDPLERVRLLINGMADILASRDGPTGCLIATFTIDTAEADAELRKHCAACFVEWGRLLQTQLQIAIDHYAPEEPLDSEQLSCYCISVIEGSLLMVRAQRSSALLTQNLELLMQQLRCILVDRLPSARQAARSRRKSAA